MSKTFAGGASARWYFAEYGRWAFSLTQELVYADRTTKIPGLFSESSGSLRGLTQVGAHYFITPGIHLGITLDYNYNILGNIPHTDSQNDLAVKAALGVSF